MSVPAEHLLRSHQLGNPSVHYYEIRDPVTGALTDPATAVITAKPPSGAALTYTYGGSGGGIFTKLGTGVYVAKVPHASGTGRWKVKLTTTTPDLVVVGEVEVIDAYA